MQRLHQRRGVHALARLPAAPTSSAPCGSRRLPACLPPQAAAAPPLAMRLSLGTWAVWKKLLVDQFMLISYLIAAIIALAWPVPGRAVLGVTISINGNIYRVFTTLFIMIGE